MHRIPKPRRIVIAVGLIGLIGFLVATKGRAEDEAPKIDPNADAALKQMGKTLTDAKAFSYTANLTMDYVLPDGQKLQTARTQQVMVRRADGIAAKVIGDEFHLNFVYDGKQLLLYNLDKPSYALLDAPPTIDEMFELLAEQYGLVIPLADMLFADPHKELTELVKSSQDMGVGYVNETECRHLAFRQDTVDWQIWIDQGPVATPRKLVITYKEKPESPQFTAVFSNWNLAAQPTADAFKIVPPPSVERIDLVKVLPTTQPTTRP